MSEIKLKLTGGGFGSQNEVVVDGNHLESAVSGLALRYNAGGHSELGLEIFVHSAEITAQGEVLINGVEISEDMASALYTALREKYGDI